MKCLTHNLEVNYPCSPACPLFGDCVVAFQNEQKKWVQTNADRIRAMSDKELAGFIEELAYLLICGKPRVRDGEKCRSRQEEKVRRKKNGGGKDVGHRTSSQDVPNLRRR